MNTQKMIHKMLGKDVSSKNKSMTEFINENKSEIDAAIHRVAPGISLNNSDRAQWINNDEGLYNWAKRSGVRV